MHDPLALCRKHGQYVIAMSVPWTGAAFAGPALVTYTCSVRSCARAFIAKV
jgi:hypothetical protein